MAAFKSFITKIDINLAGNAVLPNSGPRRRGNWNEHGQLVSTEHFTKVCFYNAGTLSEASQSQQHEDT